MSKFTQLNTADVVLSPALTRTGHAEKFSAKIKFAAAKKKEFVFLFLAELPENTCTQQIVELLLNSVGWYYDDGPDSEARADESMKKLEAVLLPILESAKTPAKRAKKS